MKKKAFAVSRISISGNADIRIALCADLHGREPGAWLNLLKNEKPDIICMAGDIIETIVPDYAVETERRHGLHRLVWILDKFFVKRDKKGIDEARVNGVAFMRGASQIAPTFYARGNHDFYLTREDRRLIHGSGAVLVDGEDSASVRVNGKTVHIGGFACQTQAGWLSRFASRHGYKLLLCHRPENYLEYAKNLVIDLTLSGHAHGGQWRVFGRGLFAPGQGLFPKYTKGLYDGKLVVSAGMSNTANIPRLNNPPEIVVVDVCSDSLDSPVISTPEI